MFKNNNKDARTMSLIWCLYCWIWEYFTLFSIVSIVDFEQIVVCWEKSIPPHATRFMMENYQILAGALDIKYYDCQQSAWFKFIFKSFSNFLKSQNKTIPVTSLWESLPSLMLKTAPPHPPDRERKRKLKYIRHSENFLFSVSLLYVQFTCCVQGMVTIISKKILNKLMNCLT